MIFCDSNDICCSIVQITSQVECTRAGSLIHAAVMLWKLMLEASLHHHINGKPDWAIRTVGDDYCDGMDLLLRKTQSG